MSAILLSSLPSSSSLSSVDFVPDGTSRCARALIITGARQGSTWFIDSVEQCRYSSAGEGTGERLYADDVFKRTELWKHFGEPALDGTTLDADAALMYIEHNSSVKIFPSVYYRRKKDVVHMLRNRKKHGFSVFVLRRDVDASWDSWVRAETSQVWNGAKKEPEGGFNQTLHDMHEYFLESRKRYDSNVDGLLNGFNFEYDVFDYDQIKTKKIIYAERNQCYIENCNYRQAVEGEQRTEEDRFVAGTADASE